MAVRTRTHRPDGVRQMNSITCTSPPDGRQEEGPEEETASNPLRLSGPASRTTDGHVVRGSGPGQPPRDRENLS